MPDALPVETLVALLKEALDNPTMNTFSLTDGSASFSPHAVKERTARKQLSLEDVDAALKYGQVFYDKKHDNVVFFQQTSKGRGTFVGMNESVGRITTVTNRRTPGPKRFTPLDAKTQQSLKLAVKNVRGHCSGITRRPLRGPTNADSEALKANREHAEQQQARHQEAQRQAQYQAQQQTQQQSRANNRGHNR